MTACPFCGGPHDPGETGGMECRPCPCKWCRDRRGEPVTPFERRQIDDHARSVAADQTREALRRRWRGSHP